jgi:hypothetical protein
MREPHYHIKTAALQSREWCLMVVNTLLSDKMISEIHDQADLRPHSDLKAFTIEWFLKKFGNKEIAEILVKDFLFSMKKFGKLHERFRLYCEFSSLDELIESE